MFYARFHAISGTPTQSLQANVLSFSIANHLSHHYASTVILKSYPIVYRSKIGSMERHSFVTFAKEGL